MFAVGYVPSKSAMIITTLPSTTSAALTKKSWDESINPAKTPTLLEKGTSVKFEIGTSARPDI